MIEKYFEKYEEVYGRMQEALKRLMDAKQDLYNLTGIKFDDMPKGNRRPTGLEVLISNIESLEEDYIERKSIYEDTKERYKKEIDGFNELQSIHKIIIKYAYLNFESNKMIMDSLKRYHNKDYSLGYIKILKSQANNKLKKLITKYNLI